MKNHLDFDGFIQIAIIVEDIEKARVEWAELLEWVEWEELEEWVE